MLVDRIQKSKLYRQLFARVARERGVTIEAILGRSRRKSVAAARHAVWYALYHQHAHSLKDVGALCDVHHTTVLGSIETHAERLGLWIAKAKCGKPIPSARSVGRCA